MYRARETNPHFLSLQPVNQPQPPESVANPHFFPSQPQQHQPRPPRLQPNSSLELPAQPQARPPSDPGIELPTQPRLQRQSKRRGRHGAGLLSDFTQLQLGASHMSDPTQSQLGPGHNSPAHSQPRLHKQPRDLELLVAASPKQPDQLSVHQQPQSSVQRIPPSRETKPFAWCIAIFCAIFWILIILTGLIVLIVYFVDHPKSPKFDVAGASLNAAYLDMNYLLNADLTILANFTNPNRKVNVNFKHVVINLYFDGVLIATEYIDHFHLGKAQYLLANIHMLTSQARLSQVHSQKLGKQIESGRVSFDIKSFFRAKSKLGNLFKYSDSFVGHCSIVMTPPPGGVLVAKTCGTKN